jgi:hypothetical protein
MDSLMIEISCAAEVFLAAALLHREQPQRSDFMIREIVARAARENVTGEIRSGVSVHASQHCVANRPPNPGRHKMLYATGKHTRRLLLPEDEVHPERTGKIFPEPGEIPEKYISLLEWAKRRYENGGEGMMADASGHSAGQEGGPRPIEQSAEGWLGSLFELEGLGKEYWKGVDPDEFVRKLREGWE